MKTKIFATLFACTIFLPNIMADATTNFEFFAAIPQYDNITFGNIGDNMVLTIDKNYQVRITGSRSGSNTHSSISASGTLCWDIESMQLFVDLSGNVQGSWSNSEDIYETVRKVDGWGVIERGLSMGSSGNYYKYEKEYSHTEYYSSSGSDSFTKTLLVEVSDDGGVHFSSGTLGETTLTGDKTIHVSYSISNSYFSPSYGTNSATSFSTTDEFGLWQWDDTRTHLYLKALNSENTLNIVIDDSLNIRQLYIESKDTTIVGNAINITDDGFTLKQFLIGFADGTNINLQLQELEKQYYYAEYNRFLATWNKDATSLIDQLKNKQLLLFGYQKLSSKYTDIYIMEGLETILNYL